MHRSTHSRCLKLQSRKLEGGSSGPVSIVEDDELRLYLQLMEFKRRLRGTRASFIVSKSCSVVA